MSVVMPIIFGLGMAAVVINGIPTTHCWNRLDSDRTDMTMISVESVRGYRGKGENKKIRVIFDLVLAVVLLEYHVNSKYDTWETLKNQSVFSQRI